MRPPSVATAWADDGSTPPGPAITAPRFTDDDGGEPAAPLPRMVGHEQGVASYAVSLPLPPARDGMTPDLTLMYASNGGPSWVGQGFELDTPMIERDRSAGVPGLDSRKAFVYRHRGAATRLVEMGPIGFGPVGGVEYRLQRDDGDVAFVLDGLGTWRAFHRDGREQTFGAAVVIPGRGPLIWRLHRERSATDTTVEYQYDVVGYHASDRLPRLREIWYGGNDRLGAEIAHPFHVVFYRDGQLAVPAALAGANLETAACGQGLWSGRPQRIDYSFGGALTNLDGEAELLRGIAVEVAWPGTSAPGRRAYQRRRTQAWQFHYEADRPCASPPRLARVDTTVDHEDGSITATPVAQFDYYRADERTIRRVPAPDLTPEAFGGDLDGDGLVDLLTCGDTPSVRKGQLDGSFTPAVPMSPTDRLAQCPNGSASMASHLFPRGCGPAVLSALSGSAELTTTDALGTHPTAVPWSADFTGDGEPDALRWVRGTPQLAVQGPGGERSWWSGPPSWWGISQSLPPAGHRTVTLDLGCRTSLAGLERPSYTTDQAFDINGDGLVDLASAFPNTGRYSSNQFASAALKVAWLGVGFLLSTGQGFTFLPNQGSAIPFLGRKRWGNLTTLLADWNGDGLLDLLSDRSVRINRGGWFDEPETTGLPLPTGVPVAVRDVDLDGRVDVVVAGALLTDARTWEAPGRLARVTVASGASAELRYRTYESIAPHRVGTPTGWVVSQITTTTPTGDADVESIEYGALVRAPLPGAASAVPGPRGFAVVTSCLAGRGTRRWYDFGPSTAGYGDLSHTEQLAGCEPMSLPVATERVSYQVDRVPSRVGAGEVVRVLPRDVVTERFDREVEVATTSRKLEYVPGTALVAAIETRGFADAADDDGRREFDYALTSLSDPLRHRALRTSERVMDPTAPVAMPLRETRYAYDDQPWGAAPIDGLVTATQTMTGYAAAGPDEPLVATWVTSRRSYGPHDEPIADVSPGNRRVEYCWDAIRSYVVAVRDAGLRTSRSLVTSWVTGAELEATSPVYFKGACPATLGPRVWGEAKGTPLPTYDRPLPRLATGVPVDPFTDLLLERGTALDPTAYPPLPPATADDATFLRPPGEALLDDNLFASITATDVPPPSAPGPWPLVAIPQTSLAVDRAPPPTVPLSPLLAPATATRITAAAEPGAIRISELATVPAADGSLPLVELASSTVVPADPRLGRTVAETRRTWSHAGGSSTAHATADAFGRPLVTSATDAVSTAGASARTERLYAQGRVRTLRTTDPRDDLATVDTTVEARDPDGTPTRLRNPDGSVARWRHLVRYTEAGTRWVEFRLDAAGFALEERRHDGRGRLRELLAYPTRTGEPLVTRYRYDSADALVAVTTPDGALVTETYDGRGLLVSYQRRRSDGGVVAARKTYAYDLDGQLATVTDGDGRVTRVVRDDYGRAITIARPPAAIVGYGDTAFTYQDDLSQPGYGALRTVTTPVETVTYGYDALGRANSQQVDLHLPLGDTTVVDTFTMEQRFAPTGETELLRWNTGTIADATLRYDGNGRLGELWDGAVVGGRRIAGLHYATSGQVRSIDELGGAVAYTYDASGRARSMSATAIGRPTFHQRIDAFDDLGNPTVRVTDLGDGDEAQTLTLSYDRMSRLVSAVDSSPYRFAMGYDGTRPAWWRETSVAGATRTALYQYRAADPAAVEKLLATDGTPLMEASYDGSGAMITRRANGVDDALVVDPEGVLRGARGVRYFDDALGQPRYAYDPINQRVTGTVGDRLDVAYSRMGGWWLRTRADRLLGPARLGADVTYAHADLTGNVAAVRAVAGAQVLRVAYSPWGEPLRTAGAGLADEPRRGFGVAAAPGDAPLRTFGVRTVDTLTRRWTRLDPVLAMGGARADGQDNDPYNFLRHNPMVFEDPSGLQVGCRGETSFSGDTLVCLSSNDRTGLSGNPGGNTSTLGACDPSSASGCPGSSAGHGVTSFAGTVRDGLRGFSGGFGGANYAGTGGYAAGSAPTPVPFDGGGMLGPTVQALRDAERERAADAVAPAVATGSAGVTAAAAPTTWQRIRRYIPIASPTTVRLVAGTYLHGSIGLPYQYSPTAEGLAYAEVGLDMGRSELDANASLYGGTGRRYSGDDASHVGHLEYSPLWAQLSFRSHHDIDAHVWIGPVTLDICGLRLCGVGYDFNPEAGGVTLMHVSHTGSGRERLTYGTVASDGASAGMLLEVASVESTAELLPNATIDPDTGRIITGYDRFLRGVARATFLNEPPLPGQFRSPPSLFERPRRRWFDP